MPYAPAQRISRMQRQRPRGSFAVSTRDLEILGLLGRYRYLRSTYIHAFVGGNGVALRWRLRELFDAGLVGRPKQQWQLANARNTPTLYEIEAKGRDLLREFDRTAVSSTATKSRYFLHEVMICEIMASIEVSVRADPTLSLISSADLVERVKPVPGRPQNPLSFDVPGGRHIIPDALFGIRGPRGAVLYALEADRENEPLRRAGKGSSYASKIEDYNALIDGGGYKRHLQTPAPLVVLHVATSERRVRNLKSLGQKRPFHLFKALPSSDVLGQLPSPSPLFVTEPWARDGLPAFAINR